MNAQPVEVVVIGAGQAGLSAAYHLRRRGFSPVPADEPSFVVLDADDEPGGAWRHRWASLKMATVNGIHELPGFAVPPADPDMSARDVLPAYFADYERRFDLGVRRPVEVRAVRRADDDPEGRLLVETDLADWAARYVVNATGTWRRPFWPHVPGAETFRGRQLHVHDYVSADEFAGKRVVIVGAGISAVQLLDEISHVADTFWVTRREVRWDATEFDTAARIAAIAGVEERMPDGTLERADVILWATGFRADIRHLAPLGLRTPAGGLRVTNGRSLDEPRLFVIGYGPSQSMVGANRAGRDAVRAIVAERAEARPVATPAR